MSGWYLFETACLDGICLMHCCLISKCIKFVAVKTTSRSPFSESIIPCRLLCSGVTKSHNGSCRAKVNDIASCYSVSRRLSRYTTKEGLVILCHSASRQHRVSCYHTVCTCHSVSWPHTCHLDSILYRMKRSTNVEL